MMYQLLIKNFVEQPLPPTASSPVWSHIERVSPARNSDRAGPPELQMQRPNAVPVTRSKTCLLLSIGVPAGCSSSSISMTSATVFAPLPCGLPAATLATTAAACGGIRGVCLVTCIWDCRRMTRICLVRLRDARWTRHVPAIGHT